MTEVTERELIDIIRKKDINKLKTIIDTINSSKDLFYPNDFDDILDNGLSILQLMLYAKWYDGIEYILKHTTKYKRIADVQIKIMCKSLFKIHPENLYLLAQENDKKRLSKKRKEKYKYSKLLAEVNYNFPPGMFDDIISSDDYKINTDLQYIIQKVSEAFLLKNDNFMKEDFLNACNNARLDDVIKYMTKFKNSVLKRGYIIASKKNEPIYFEIMNLIEKKLIFHNKLIDSVDMVNKSFYFATKNENMEVINYLITLHDEIGSILQFKIPKCNRESRNKTFLDCLKHKKFINYGIRGACLSVSAKIGNMKLINFIFDKLNKNISYYMYCIGYIIKCFNRNNGYIILLKNMISEFLNNILTKDYEEIVLITERILREKEINYDLIKELEIKIMLYVDNHYSNQKTYVKHVCMAGNITELKKIIIECKDNTSDDVRRKGSAFIGACIRKTPAQIEIVNILLDDFFNNPENIGYHFYQTNTIGKAFRILCKKNNFDAAKIIIDKNKDILEIIKNSTTSNLELSNKNLTEAKMIYAYMYDRFDIMKYILKSDEDAYKYILHPGISTEKMSRLYHNNIDLYKANIPTSIIDSIKARISLIIAELLKFGVIKELSDIILYYL